MEKSDVHLEWKELHLDRAKLMGVFRVGLPAGFQGIVFALSNVVIQSSINSFGNVVVAGNSAAGNLEGFVYVAMNAFYQAAISFTGQNVGAGNKKRVFRIMLAAEACVIVTGLLLGNGVYFLGKPLLGIYSPSEAVINAGMARLTVISCTYALCGMMDVMVGVLRGMGYSIMPMFVSLMGACVLRLVWLGTVFQIEQYRTVFTVYLSYPITWIITFLTHVICFVVVYRKYTGAA